MTAPIETNRPAESTEFTESAESAESGWDCYLKTIVILSAALVCFSIFTLIKSSNLAATVDRQVACISRQSVSLEMAETELSELKAELKAMDRDLKNIVEQRDAAKSMVAILKMQTAMREEIATDQREIRGADQNAD